MSSNTGNIGLSNVVYKLSIMPVVCELAMGVLWGFQEQSKQTNNNNMHGLVSLFPSRN